MKTFLFVVYFLFCIFLSFSTISSAAENKTENVKTEHDCEDDSFEDILNGIFPKKYDKETRPLIRNATFNIDTFVYIHDMNRVIFADFLLYFCL